ncbi:hypothetical protein Tco_0914410 [Tanacetum coccineum]
MDTGCRLFLVACPLFLQFLGASFTQGRGSSIPIVGSVSPKGFLPPILLLVVIIVTVVIVAVILVVVVVAIVRVVIVVAIIGVVVVVGGVSFIIKLSFVIIGNTPMKASMSFSEFGTMFGQKNSNSWNLLIPDDPVGLFYPNRLGICIPSRQGIIGVSLGPMFLLGLSAFAIEQLVLLEQQQHYQQLDTTEILEFKTSRDRYRDNGVSDPIGGLVFKGGGISSGGKKYRESNISDSDNTRDGGKTTRGGIVTCGGLMASYACMTFIYGSSCKGEKTSVVKIYLVKSFEESGEVFPGVAGKCIESFIKGGKASSISVFRWER